MRRTHYQLNMGGEQVLIAVAGYIHTAQTYCMKKMQPGMIAVAREPCGIQSALLGGRMVWKPVFVLVMSAQAYPRPFQTGSKEFAADQKRGRAGSIIGTEGSSMQALGL